MTKHRRRRSPAPVLIVLLVWAAFGLVEFVALASLARSHLVRLAGGPVPAIMPAPVAAAVLVTTAAFIVGAVIQGARRRRVR